MSPELPVNQENLDHVASQSKENLGRTVSPAWMESAVPLDARGLRVQWERRDNRESLSSDHREKTEGLEETEGRASLESVDPLDRKVTKDNPVVVFPGWDLRAQSVCPDHRATTDSQDDPESTALMAFPVGGATTAAPVPPLTLDKRAAPEMME